MKNWDSIYSLKSGVKDVNQEAWIFGEHRDLSKCSKIYQIKKILILLALP